MLNLPVHWYEGMFLRPQHFQAAERSWSEILATAIQFSHPYAYGVYEIAISEEAISNASFEVSALEARMKDGSLINLSVGQQPDRLSLKAAFEKSAVVTVYLATPKLTIGRPNVSIGGNAPLARYEAVDVPVQDETSGGKEQEIQFRQLNLKLLLSTDYTTGYELLPIARVRRTGESVSGPQLDGDYFPPLLNSSAWPALDRGILRAIYDLIGQKITLLSEFIGSRGITLAATEPGDLDRIVMLQILNEAYGKLGCLSFAHGVHPFTQYTELCRIVGALSIFAPDRQVGQLPHYDHEDLARIFKTLKERIMFLMNRVGNMGYEQRFFQGRVTGGGKEAGMSVRLETKWLGVDWEWFVGVTHSGLPTGKVQELLLGLDWKMGSAAQVDELFRRRAEGVKLLPRLQAPRQLPITGNWVYYEVARGNTAWNDVLRDQSLAMRIKEEAVSNLAELEGNRKVEVSHRGMKATLEFALFAVPKQPQQN